MKEAENVHARRENKEGGRGKTTTTLIHVGASGSKVNNLEGQNKKTKSKDKQKRKERKETFQRCVERGGEKNPPRGPQFISTTESR